VVSLGHSGRTEAEADAAFTARRLRCFTHSFNAMPGLAPPGGGSDRRRLLRRRRPISPRLIADGLHVTTTMAVLLQRLGAPRQRGAGLVMPSAPYGLRGRPRQRRLGMSGRFAGEGGKLLG